MNDNRKFINDLVVNVKTLFPELNETKLMVRVEEVVSNFEVEIKNSEKLKEDIKDLLAPWAVGKYDKLTFGQCVYRSDIIRFLENTDYVDFVTDFKMGKELIIPAVLIKDSPRFS